MGVILSILIEQYSFIIYHILINQITIFPNVHQIKDSPPVELALFSPISSLRFCRVNTWSIPFFLDE